MSEHAARAALSRMHMREVAIAPTHSSLLADLQHFATVDPTKGHESFLASRFELCAAMGLTPAAQMKPFAFSDGVAVIPVHGSLINRFGGSYDGVTGYNFIRSQAQAAAADPDVRLIAFDLNSNGGEAAGCFELSRELVNLGKPTLGIIDSNCYSACYAIGSSLDRLVGTPSAGAGSIGVVTMHVDMSKFLSNVGVDVTLLYSGDHKVDGNPFMALPDELKAEIQASLGARRQEFAQLVADNRGLDVQAVLDTQARTYRAEQAMSLGLIDAVSSPSEAVMAYLTELSGSTDPQTKRKVSCMTQDSTKPGSNDQAQATAEARAAERARIQGIQSCEEAKGRESLANHLALGTDMSVDAAKAILAAAPVAAAAPATTPTSASTDPLKAAMAASKHPNVGPDAEGGGAAGGEQLSLAQQILRDQAAATGRKMN